MAKFVPVSVIRVPPAVLPKEGLIEVTSNWYLTVNNVVLDKYPR